MKPRNRLPLIGVPADTETIQGALRHRVHDRYVRAIAQATGALPVVLPALTELLSVDAVLENLDGIVLTGSVSNVHPERFGQAAGSAMHEPFDERRDDLTLQLTRAAVANGVPVLGICRGCQELNVALGGTLEAEIQQVAGRLDHRAPISDDQNVRYAEAHAVEVVAGGQLDRLLGVRKFTVNSLHRQAVALLGRGLRVEAYAPDGVIEAVSAIASHQGFVLGLQWHPEHDVLNNPVSRKIFGAFGDAVRAYRGNRGLGMDTPATADWLDAAVS